MRPVKEVPYREALAKCAAREPRKLVALLYHSLYDMVENQFDGSYFEELYLRSVFAPDEEKQNIQFEYMVRTLLKDAVKYASMQEDAGPFDWAAFMNQWMIKSEA